MDFIKHLKNVKNLIKHLRIPLLLVTLILAVILPVTSVFAIDPPSTSPTIDAINAYQGVIEDEDQFFLIQFSIPYSTYPTESANEAYLLRMFNAAGTVEIYSTGLYNNPYYHAGYGKGIVSFYFSAQDVIDYGLTWGDAYIYHLQGNPALTWNGTAPDVLATLGTWTTTDVNAAVSARVLYLANLFQGQWGVQLVDSGTLSVYGENYFTSTIPYLRLMVTDIFNSYVEPATEFRGRTHTLTYALTLRNQWAGTWLDMTNVAADWGVDKVWIYGLLWLPVLIGIGWVTIYLNGRREQARDTKPLFYVEALAIFFGGLLGFLPWLAAVLVAVIFAFIIINQIFFSKSY